MITNDIGTIDVWSEGGGRLLLHALNLLTLLLLSLLQPSVEVSLHGTVAIHLRLEGTNIIFFTHFYSLFLHHLSLKNDDFDYRYFLSKPRYSTLVDISTSSFAILEAFLYVSKLAFT